MIAFPFRGTRQQVIAGTRIHLRHPDITDHGEWVALRAESAEFLKRWEPVWPANDFDKVAFRGRIRRYNREIAAGTGYPYFICDKQDGRILGGITLGNVRRGVAQSGQIGYWIGVRYQGHGYMSEALGLLCEQAFTTFGLHRLEAACIPDNTRSIRVLERTGFEREGYLHSYLKINGIWRDHVLYARINPHHERGGATVKLGEKA
ncbi:GNAT family N-acetyltransferase [Oricola thermophila]|uniref:GNAT family N-acetyltransferase n=1 Tax=Oricola thermophila TaxID=2742145 RepID=A0A6N1VD61_9HYPH|nr:GNAT family protein [Oricola thermophila]QKV18866.1 GNAT family N-acetyltransferase [Oricola thermophila]